MSKQINIEYTKLIRIDAQWHKYLKLYSASSGRPIRDLVEEALADCYNPVINKNQKSVIFQGEKV